MNEEELKYLDWDIILREDWGGYDENLPLMTFEMSTKLFTDDHEDGVVTVGKAQGIFIAEFDEDYLEATDQRCGDQLRLAGVAHEIIGTSYTGAFLLEKLEVHEKYRRQGIGRKIIDQIFEWMSRMHLQNDVVMVLQAFPLNQLCTDEEVQNVKDFYLGQGFAPIVPGSLFHFLFQTTYETKDLIDDL